ncbi:MAG TPA: oligopeptide/dipeptide ABC transporter ATP-binding protein, partial [Spirochaetia bacterium]|nr:oligopeptide/dipeptide ABC transporter ATP-binding protein [Spirochaetia bacterium]
LILQILDPTEGEVYFRGKPLSRMDPPELREYRRRVQMIFQDPFASLDPMMTLHEIITEPYDIFHLYTRTERRDRSADLLRRVGLDPSYGGRYPHELSGGQRQRVAIARALTLQPRAIIADEPTSALDVSVKAQIINLLEKLRSEEGLAIVFISHDLSMVQHISDRIIVMYLGKIVESGPTAQIFDAPSHPYTRALLDAIPRPDPRRRRARVAIRGEAVGGLGIERGCVFYPRCSLRTAECLAAQPPLVETAPGRNVACIHPLGYRE